MKFGKVDHIDSIHFQLPEEPAFTTKFLEILDAGRPEKNLYIGCTGWGMKEWVGHVYPAGAKQKDFLQHYTQQFNTIELNTTHYRIPNAATIDKWKTAAGSDFKFCPKIPQTISHSRNLGMGTGQIDAFCDAVIQLDSSLGCCFLQLPPYFGTDRFALLQQFLAVFPKEVPLAIEMRHESWFNDSNQFDRLLTLLNKEQISTVITDVAGRRDVLHMGLTTDKVLIRFVGNNLHPSDYSRIDDWLIKLYQWYEQGLQAVYFFTHEPDNLRAPELAAYLHQQVIKNASIQSRGPVFYKSDQSSQMSLFN